MKTWVCCVILMCAGVSVAATKIEKLVAFPTADSVRVQVELSGDKDVELQGEINPLPEGPAFWTGRLDQEIKGLKPKLWTPASPNLYLLKVTATKNGREVASCSVRVGFRSFTIEKAQFRLNGKPIFLRGIAINPPGRTVPDAVGESREFAHAYVSFLKSQNVNVIRLEHDSQVWFDVCDELGMMVYQGVYGSPPGSTKDQPPTDVTASVEGYKRIFETYANHPSIVIYIMSNELPYTGQRGAAWHEFLNTAHGDLKKWDSTRPYIGNAGYGQGHGGDINDVHRYWGWYYNSFLTFYNLRDVRLFGEYEKNQPLTFTECVGCFTGPHGGFNLVEKKQLGAQLGWTGWADDQRKFADQHQCRVIQSVCESFRRMRPLNPRIAGVMPFTILFDNWMGIKSFDEMKAKPAMKQLAASYQPLLLSWELWTGQVYAGTTITPTAHVVNDAEDFADLEGARLVYSIGEVHGEKELPRIPYYGNFSTRLEVDLPKDLATGVYNLIGEIRKNGKTMSRNETSVFVAGAQWNEPAPKLDRSIALFDLKGTTAKALDRLEIAYTQTDQIAALDPAKNVLIIAEGAGVPDRLEQFIRKGGRVLCLAQDPQKMRTDWLPAQVEFFTASANDPTYPPAHRPTRDQSNLNPQWFDHPVLQGVPRERLEFWSDYSNWDQTKDGFPQIYPVTRGYKLTDVSDLEKTAIILNYDRGLEGIALAEFFDGSGSVILSGLDIVSRVGLDPVADRMLRNLAMYVASDAPHEVHPRVTSPIVWGDYPRQQGVLCGTLQGLLVNVEWKPPPTAPDATPLTRDEGAWNTRPSDQFLPHGVRPFGPYTWTTGSGLRDLNRSSTVGSGLFWACVPKGTNEVVTEVQNPQKLEAHLQVEVNSQPGQTSTIPAGKTIKIRTPIARDATDVCVKYTGEKELVILQTVFLDKRIVQAHRGAGELAPENTLEAFQLGWKMGCIPESDLRTTCDGVIVAFHDENFKRVVKNAPAELRDNGVADVTWDQLSKLDVGAWKGETFQGRRVSKIADVLALMSGHEDRQLYLDIKNVDLRPLANLVHRHHVERQVILASTKYDIIRQWKSLIPESQTLLWMGGTEQALSKRLEELRKTNFADITQLQVHVHVKPGTNDFEESDAFLKSVGQELRPRGILYQSLPYGGATKDVYWKLLDLGIESYATDHPDVTLEAIREHTRR